MQPVLRHAAMPARSHPADHDTAAAFPLKLVQLQNDRGNSLQVLGAKCAPGTGRWTRPWTICRRTWAEPRPLSTTGASGSINRCNQRVVAGCKESKAISGGQL